MNNKIKILRKPLGLRALKNRATISAATVKGATNPDGFISVNVPISLEELIGKSVDDLNDWADEAVLDEKVGGSLSNITYTVVGHIPMKKNEAGWFRGQVILNITADVSDIIGDA